LLTITEFKQFPERTHYTLGQKGRQEIADYALNWATQMQTAGATNTAHGVTNQCMVQPVSG
jgi:hypothetical protein